jgi:transcriptional repressor NrdR
MICPKCACEHTRVKSTIKSLTVLRWRVCERCGYVWATEEKPKDDQYLRSYVQDIESDKKNALHS